MHRVITLELHWFIFAGIILLFLAAGLVRWFVRLDKPVDHKYNIFYLMLLMVFVITWISIYCR